MGLKREWIQSTATEPCVICGKAGWCSRLANGKIIDCKREVGQGHYRTSTKGGATHHFHRGEGQAAPPITPRVYKADARIASPEIRDRVYRALLAELGLSPVHRGRLAGRGLPGAVIDDRLFATLAGGRQALAARVRERVGLTDEQMIGVPGFYLGDYGVLSLAGMAGLLVPTFDMGGRVVGIQVRADGADSEFARYTWLSGIKRGGAPAEPLPHCPPYQGDRTTARLTEGMLKAEVALANDGIWTVSVPGVSSWQRAIPAFKQAGTKVVRLAFDADWTTKKDVCNALVGAAARLASEGFEVQVETWPLETAKGIDDLIATGQTPTLLVGHAAVDFLAAARALHAPTASDTGPRILRNYTLEEVEDEKPRKVGRRLADIAAELAEITGGWPKRVGEAIFVPSPKSEPVYIASPSRLFAWIGSQCQVDWAPKSYLCHTQEHLYEFLRMNADHYEAIETLPHWPKLEGTYYLHREVPKAEGRLDQLLDMLCPETDEDRELIRAMIVTLFWGGRPGSRPAFLVTASADDAQQGRGVGKSTLAEILGEELAGGYVDVSANDDMASVKTRILSSAGRHKRVVRIDNLKVERLSWADLEGVVTSSWISGRELYQGEGRRRNTLVWILTVNGGATSKDMAQRLVPIRLSRPRAYSPDWDERFRTFLREHRWSIAADCRAIIERQSSPLAIRSRWSSWEHAILSKVGDADAVQALILKRRAEIDADEDDKEEAIAIVEDRLTRAGHDADLCVFFLPMSVLGVWLNEGRNTKEAFNKVSAYLKRLNHKQLQWSKRGVRGFIWRGKDAPPHAIASTWIESAAGYSSSPY